MSLVNQDVFFHRCEQAKACQKENQKLRNNLEHFSKAMLTIAAHSTEIPHLGLGRKLSWEVKAEKKTSQIVNEPLFQCMRTAYGVFCLYLPHI